jgi:hypothetical protein
MRAAAPVAAAFFLQGVGINQKNPSFFSGRRQFLPKIRLHYTSKESIIGAAGQGRCGFLSALATYGESNLR